MTVASPEGGEVSTPAKAKRGRSLWLNLLLSLVAFGLLAAAIYSNREQIRGVFERKIDYRLLGLAFVVYMSGLMLTFVRWFVLLRAVDVRMAFADAIRLGFIGNVFNLVIPGAVGGDVVKAGFVYQKVPRERFHRGIASMVIDRIVGLLGLFALAAALGALAWGRTGEEVHRLTLIACGAVACGVVGLFVLFTPGLYRPLEKLLGGGKLEKALERLVEVASDYRAKLPVVIGTIGMSVVNHGMNVLAFYIGGLALFGEVPSLWDHFVIVPLVLFTTAVPLPFGALGLTEQVSGRLFELVSHPGGAVAMMAFRVITYAGAVVSILVYLANLRQVREAQAAAERIEDEPPAA